MDPVQSHNESCQVAQEFCARVAAELNRIHDLCNNVEMALVQREPGRSVGTLPTTLQSLDLLGQSVKSVELVLDRVARLPQIDRPTLEGTIRRTIGLREMVNRLCDEDDVVLSETGRPIALRSEIDWL